MPERAPMRARVIHDVGLDDMASAVVSLWASAGGPYAVGKAEAERRLHQNLELYGRSHTQRFEPVDRAREVVRAKWRDRFVEATDA